MLTGLVFVTDELAGSSRSDNGSGVNNGLGSS